MTITATITADVPDHLVTSCKINPSNPTEYMTRYNARNAVLHIVAEEFMWSLSYHNYNDVMAMTRIRGYIIRHVDETLFTLP